MVPVMSLLVPILVASVIVFIASSIIHMVTPFHKGDLKRVPNEDGVMSALRNFNLAPGDYAMPLPSSMAAMGSPEFQAKMAAGPVVMMTVRPSGKHNMTTNLVQWFVYSVRGVAVCRLRRGRRAAAGRRLPQGVPDRRLRGVHRLRHGACSRRRFGAERTGGQRCAAVADGLLYGLLTGGTFGWLWP